MFCIYSFYRSIKAAAGDTNKAEQGYMQLVVQLTWLIEIQVKYKIHVHVLIHERLGTPLPSCQYIYSGECASVICHFHA